MRALRRFTVRAALPEPLEPLGDLVANLRWSWNPDSLDLFDAVDPDGWERCAHDPVKLLGEVGADRMAALAKDRRFLRRLKDAHEDLDDYLTADRWYQGLDASAPRAIAYFSPEFGITEVLPQYSGGLGILAGDHLKAASDLGVPILGVGLLYRRGYFKQTLSPRRLAAGALPAAGPQRHAADPASTPRPATRSRSRVGLPGGRELRAQVWRAQVGRVPLLMLDSDVDDNAADRAGRHRPAVRRGSRPPARPGDAARHRRRPRRPRLLRADRRTRPRRCSTPTRATPASSASSGSAS